MTGSWMLQALPLGTQGAGPGTSLAERLVGVVGIAWLLSADRQGAGIMGGGGELGPRGTVIATYALLGFANFSSIAIQIGGIGGLAPERRGDLAKLGLKAMIGGNLAAIISAALAGMLA